MAITETELNGIWNYYLSLEADMANTSRYIEPAGQENVYSFEFAKLLILSCTEVESVLKIICCEIEGRQVRGNMDVYRETVLRRYPKIVQSTVYVSRLGKNIEPFAAWNTGKLSWWYAYQEVKHNRAGYFTEATYQNAVNALAALYILIFYLAKIFNLDFDNRASSYITSKYSYEIMLFRAPKELPDFEEESP